MIVAYVDNGLTPFLWLLSPPSILGHATVHILGRDEYLILAAFHLCA